MKELLRKIIQKGFNKYIDITNLEILEQDEVDFKVRYKIVHAIKDASASKVAYTYSTITLTDGKIIEN